MATLSSLVKAIADVQGLEENQVLWIARHLREAGLISQGGRGRGGARMNVRDAANLLIGVNSPSAASKAVGMVHVFRDLALSRDFAAPDDQREWDDLRSDDDYFSRAFRRGSYFGDSLEALVKDFRNPVDWNSLAPDEVAKITLSGPAPRATIYIGDAMPERAGDVQTESVFDHSHLSGFSVPPLPDQQVSKTFTHKTLAAVSLVLDS